MYLCIYFPFIVKNVIIIIVIILIIINVVIFFFFFYYYYFFLTEDIEKDNIDPHCNRFDLHFI